MKEILHLNLGKENTNKWINKMREAKSKKHI